MGVRIEVMVTMYAFSIKRATPHARRGAIDLYALLTHFCVDLKVALCLTGVNTNDLYASGIPPVGRGELG